jgi:hypothetical protein
VAVADDEGRRASKLSQKAVTRPLLDTGASGSSTRAFIDAHKDAFGVEPICRLLPIAPSTCYAAKARPPSARAVSDA